MSVSSPPRSVSSTHLDTYIRYLSYVSLFIIELTFLLNNMENKHNILYICRLLFAPVILIGIRIVRLPVGCVPCGIGIVSVAVVVRGIQILSDDIGPDAYLCIGVGTRCRIII